MNTNLILTGYIHQRAPISSGAQKLVLTLFLLYAPGLWALMYLWGYERDFLFSAQTFAFILVPYTTLISSFFILRFKKRSYFKLYDHKIVTKAFWQRTETIFMLKDIRYYKILDVGARGFVQHLHLLNSEKQLILLLPSTFSNWEALIEFCVTHFEELDATFVESVLSNWRAKAWRF